VLLWLLRLLLLWLWLLLCSLLPTNKAVCEWSVMFLSLLNRLAWGAHCMSPSHGVYI
jgi:hypothetical protein